METIYILYIIIGVLTLSNIFFIYRGTQLVRQVEDTLNETSDIKEETILTLEKMSNDMKEIDIRGSFENDDEVGVVFKELKSIIDKNKNNL